MIDEHHLARGDLRRIRRGETPGTVEFLGRMRQRFRSVWVVISTSCLLDIHSSDSSKVDLDPVMTRVGYQTVHLSNIMRTRRNIAEATSPDSCNAFYPYRYKVSSSISAGTSFTAPGTRPTVIVYEGCRRNETDYKVVAECVALFLEKKKINTSKRKKTKKTAILCETDINPSYLSAKLKLPGLLLYTDQSEDMSSVEAWLDQGGVLLTHSHKFKGCEADVVIVVAGNSYCDGVGLRSGLTRGIASICLILSNINVEVDKMKNMFEVIDYNNNKNEKAGLLKKTRYSTDDSRILVELIHSASRLSINNLPAEDEFEELSLKVHESSADFLNGALRITRTTYQEEFRFRGRLATDKDFDAVVEFLKAKQNMVNLEFRFLNLFFFLFFSLINDIYQSYLFQHILGPVVELKLPDPTMTVPQGLAIAPAHFLAAPEEEYRNYIEGDQHEHYVVKIDSLNGHPKMKLFDSFIRVDHKFSFASEGLSNHGFCHLTTAGFLGFGGGKPQCDHASAAKTFIVSKNINWCPLKNGALRLNLFCDEFASDKNYLEKYFERKGEQCLLKYNEWNDFELGEHYRIEAKLGRKGEAGKLKFSFLSLCRANGKMTLGSIPSSHHSHNCKDKNGQELYLPVFVEKIDAQWEEIHTNIIPKQLCTDEDHADSCIMIRNDDGSESAIRQPVVSIEQPYKPTAGSSQCDSNEQRVEGDHNKLQSGGTFNGTAIFIQQ